MLENTYVMGEQQLREMALNAMLLAVDAQASALKSMDREHSFGVENSFAVDNLRAQVKDLVQSTQSIVKSGSQTCVSELRQRIQAVAVNGRQIKASADRFDADARPRAKSRYDRMVMQLGLNPAPKPEESGSSAADAEAGKAETGVEIAGNPRALTAQASLACLRAEVDEYKAFAMQIHAVINLALEYALNAAAKCSRCNNNI